MPSIKQGGGFTLTFSKRNEDVKKILEEKKASGIVITNYICDAIRLYEEYRVEAKDTNSTIAERDIDALIESKIKAILNDMNLDLVKKDNEVVKHDPERKKPKIGGLRNPNK
ncbi:MAG: hypothetical protein ACRDD7_03430 [Peptostreptococcaceae bacterium]